MIPIDGGLAVMLPVSTTSSEVLSLLLRHLVLIFHFFRTFMYHRSCWVRASLVCVDILHVSGICTLVRAVLPGVHYTDLCSMTVLLCGAETMPFEALGNFMFLVLCAHYV